MLPRANYLELYPGLMFVCAYLCVPGGMNQSRLPEELQTDLSIDQEKWWFDLFRIASVNEDLLRNW